MFESTYNDLIERSKHHENINDLIASHEDLEEVPVKTIYNIRTKINKQLNSVYNVIKLLNRNKNFISSVLMDQNDAMCGCVVVNKFVVNSYCDIIIVDDTVGVDKLDYPVETVVCKDGNGHLQQVGFGFLLNKTEEGFRLFFEKFRELAEKELIVEVYLLIYLFMIGQNPSPMPF